MHTQWPWHNTQLLALQMLPDGTWASRYGKSPSENSPSPQPCKQQGLQKNKHSCSCAHAAQCKPPCVTMSSPSGHDAQPMSDLNPQIWAGRGCIQGLGHSSCHSHRSPGKANSPRHLQKCLNIQIYTCFKAHRTLNIPINSTNIGNNQFQ